jgi:hypothetical protein
MRTMPYAQDGKWRARWLDATGKLRSKNFDDHRSAATHENQMKAEADEIRRGLRSPAPPRRTFDQLCDEWLATRAKRKRSAADDISVSSATCGRASGR